jgi:hypothetical protein
VRGRARLDSTANSILHSTPASREATMDGVPDHGRTGTRVALAGRPRVGRGESARRSDAQQIGAAAELPLGRRDAGVAGASVAPFRALPRRPIRKHRPLRLECGNCTCQDDSRGGARKTSGSGQERLRLSPLQLRSSSRAVTWRPLALASVRRLRSSLSLTRRILPIATAPPRHRAAQE